MTEYRQNRHEQGPWRDEGLNTPSPGTAEAWGLRDCLLKEQQQSFPHMPPSLFPLLPYHHSQVKASIFLPVDP